MPISIQAPVVALLSIALIGVGLWSPQKATTKGMNRKSLIAAGLFGLVGPLLIFMSFELCFWIAARHGSSSARFFYSRWIESAPDTLQCYTVIWVPHRFDQAWYWLEKAANEGHPEAQYALGVRLKRNIWIHQNTRFKVEDGQKMIDKALAAGYVPTGPEESYRLTTFRLESPFCLF